MPENKEKRIIRQDKWDRENMTKVFVKLHNVNDADVIDYLNASGNKADAIRQAIREKIEREKMK